MQTSPPSDPTPIAPTPTDPLVVWTEAGVVHVAGDVDAATRASFDDALQACADPSVRALDLSGVEFFSAAGVGCLSAADWFDEPPVPIVASPVVRRVLGMCGLDDLVVEADDVDGIGGSAAATSSRSR